MCDMLSEKLGNNPKIPKQTPPDEIQNQDINQKPGPFDMPTTNFGDIVDFVPIPNKHKSNCYYP